MKIMKTGCNGYSNEMERLLFNTREKDAKWNKILKFISTSKKETKEFNYMKINARIAKYMNS